ncbi:MAG: hypothetical protein WBC05_22385 [Sedimentisphaerales bacterium]
MRKRTVKILKIIAIILVVLSLIYAIAVGVSAAKLRRAYADLKKDGRPMKQADVIPPEVPDSENAALLYESAALLLKAQPAPEGNLLVYLGGLSDMFIKETIDPDKLAELQQLIEQDVVTQALSVVEQGTQRRSCRFDHNYNAGINILLPNLPLLRRLTFILSAKARLEARAGNPDNAWNMARIQLRLADALLTEPIMISQVVRYAMIRMSCRTIRELCEIAPPNEQQFRSVEDLLAGLDEVAPMVRGIDGERLLLGEWAFNLPKNELYKINLNPNDERLEDMPGIIYRLLILRATFKPLFLADRATYMRLMHKSAQLFQLFGDSYSHEQANNELYKLSSDIEKIERNEKRHLLTSMLFPSIIRVKQIHREMTAELRITRTGLALLQHKQSRDAFPDTLEALKLSDIIDPYSAEPLRYKAQGQDFIIYSIGPDRKDNGGSPRVKKQEKDWDIVWSYTGGR